MSVSPPPSISESVSAPASRRWIGPVAVLAGVLAILWAIPVVVDSLAGGLGLAERAVLFLLATLAVGCGFLAVIAQRRRRSRRR